MKLAPVLARVIPPEVTQEIQAWMIVVGLVGLAVAFFLPPGPAVRVINIASMLALIVSGLAGLDATRPNAGGID